MAESENNGSLIKKGAEVKIIDWPGSALQYGDVGLAESGPDESGLFWVEFSGGRRHHVRVSEVTLA